MWQNLGVPQWPFPNEAAKIKIFNHLRYTHETFKIGIYNGKLYDRSLNWVLQKSNFSTIQARHMKP